MLAVGIISISIAAVALVLSLVSLYMQRALPRMEGQVLHYGANVAVAVRNTGKAAAKAPWFTVEAPGGMWANNHVSNGFLGIDQNILAVTEIPTEALEGKQAIGVVGCVDSKGRFLYWPLDGGRKRRRNSVTFEEAFRSVNGRNIRGEQMGSAQQKE